MSFDVRRLDRTDESVLRDYWSLGKASMTELPFDHWPSWDYARRFWAQPTSESDVVVLGAYDGEEMVGGAFTGAPTNDNLHLLSFEVVVAPDARRRGVGSALVAAVEGVGAEAGRSTFLTEAVVPAQAETAALSFAAAHGYVRASLAECKVAEMDDDRVDLAALAASAAERVGPYTLIWWTDPAPDDRLDDVCALSSAFLGEIPTEDLDLQPRTWTPEIYREREARRAGAGQRHLLVAAVSPQGRLVGYSDVSVADGLPDRAEIDHTLVLPEHRGHRLGLALKVALHQQVRELFPDVQRIVTYNAGVNEHMNAVNRALGYQVRQHVVGLQKKV